MQLRYAFGYFSAPCPTLSVQPTCGPADDGSGARYALTVSGTGYGAPPPAVSNPSSNQAAFGFGVLPVHIELDGTEVPGSPATPGPDGTFSVLVTPARVKAGVHVLHAYVTTGDAPKPLVATNVTRNSTTQFTVPCANTQTTPTTPTTAPTTPDDRADHADDGAHDEDDHQDDPDDADDHHADRQRIGRDRADLPESGCGRQQPGRR